MGGCLEVGLVWGLDGHLAVLHWRTPRSWPMAGTDLAIPMRRDRYRPELLARLQTGGCGGSLCGCRCVAMDPHVFRAAALGTSADHAWCLRGYAPTQGDRRRARLLDPAR